MKWAAHENKNLLVPEKDNFEFQGKRYRKVILNPELNSALVKMDKYFAPCSEIVTSGVRTPDDSLRIIRQYLRANKLEKIYPYAMTCAIDQRDGKNYVWQEAWSHLLNIGVIINPPLEAVVLKDYFRDGVNKKGNLIKQSPHVRGTSLDLSGLDSLEIVKKLKQDGIIRGYLVERANSCIHLDI